MLRSLVIVFLVTPGFASGFGSGLDGVEKKDEGVPPAAKIGQDKLHSQPSDPAEGEKPFSEVVLPHPGRNCTDRIEINLKMYLHNVKVIRIFPQPIHSHHKEIIVEFHVKFPPLFFRIIFSIKDFLNSNQIVQMQGPTLVNFNVSNLKSTPLILNLFKLYLERSGKPLVIPTGG